MKYDLLYRVWELEAMVADNEGTARSRISDVAALPEAEPIRSLLREAARQLSVGREEEARRELRAAALHLAQED